MGLEQQNSLDQKKASDGQISPLYNSKIIVILLLLLWSYFGLTSMVAFIRLKFGNQSSLLYTSLNVCKFKLVQTCLNLFKMQNFVNFYQSYKDHNEGRIKIKAPKTCYFLFIQEMELKLRICVSIRESVQVYANLRKFMQIFVTLRESAQVNARLDRFKLV